MSYCQSEFGCQFYSELLQEEDRPVWKITFIKTLPIPASKTTILNRGWILYVNPRFYPSISLRWRSGNTVIWKFSVPFTHYIGVVPQWQVLLLSQHGTLAVAGDEKRHLI